MSSTGASAIKKLAVRGAIWTVLGYGASQLIRFGSNLVLTRFIAPELFGLMNLVYTFMIGLHLFSDLGINASVIQNKRGDEPTFLNTAWTLQILRGLGIWLVCLMLAVPVSHIYQKPELLWLIPIVGFSTVLSGFNSTAIITLNRHLSVKQLALFELSGQIVSVSVMLIWAWISPTIWALVAGGTTSAIFQLIVSHRLNAGVKNRFAWDAKVIKELISFGKWIFLATALTFLANQSDRLILAKLFPLALFGVYGVAYTLADLPNSLLSAVNGKVLYPTYSKLVDLPRAEFRGKVLRNRLPILLALTGILAVAVGFGDIIVKVLYREEYAANASWMMPLLALGTWPLMLTKTVDPLLLALGKPQYSTVASFLSFLVYAIGIPAGFHSPLHEVGAVLAVACSNIPIWIVITFACWREKLLMIWQDIGITAVFLAVLSLLFLLRHAWGLGVPFANLL